MPLKAMKRRPNPTPLGWVGIGLGATAGVAAVVGLAFAGVVFYRMTKM